MEHNTTERHYRWLVLLANVIAPGAGLVILRREWLGVSLAILCTLFLQVALWGFFILPASIPWAVSVLAAVAGAGTWAAAQWLGRVRACAVLGEEARQGLALLRDRALRAMEDGRFSEARELLQIALAMNDEDLEVHVLWARLLTLTGKFDEARPAWERVIRLDEDGVYRVEAVEAVDHFPD